MIIMILIFAAVGTVAPGVNGLSGIEKPISTPSACFTSRLKLLAHAEPAELCHKAQQL